MSTTKHKRGWTPLPTGEAALVAAGCDAVYIQGRDETLEDAIHSLRRGDVFVVAHLYEVARPTKPKRGEVAPSTRYSRNKLEQTVIAIEAQGATILELSTGRDSAIPEAKTAMLMSAAEAIISGARGRAAVANGKLSMGRPAVNEWTPAQLAVMAMHWFDTVNVLSNDDAAALVNADPLFAGRQPPVTKHHIWEAMRDLKGSGLSGRKRHKPVDTVRLTKQDKQELGEAMQQYALRKLKPK
jgi:hypothetical protein